MKWDPKTSHFQNINKDKPEWGVKEIYWHMIFLCLRFTVCEMVLLDQNSSWNIIFVNSYQLLYCMLVHSRIIFTKYSKIFKWIRFRFNFIFWCFCCYNFPSFSELSVKYPDFTLVSGMKCFPTNTETLFSFYFF